MVAVNSSAALAALRLLMRAANVTLPDRTMDTVSLQAYIVPAGDAHRSEYASPHDARVQFVSGFSGTAAVAVVLADNGAALWTDSRYFLQAREQMDSNWILMKQGVEGTPEIGEFLCRNLSSGSKVGVNPNIIPLDKFEEYNNAVKPCGITLLPVKKGLVDIVWDNSGRRPPLTLNPVKPLDLKYTGKTFWDKISEVKQKMKEARASMLVLADLFETAYDQQPVRCRVLPYEMFQGVLEVTAEGKSYENNPRVWLPNESTNYAIASVFPSEIRYTETSPVAKLKARKNAAEMQGMKLSHVKDGVALVQFLHWLDGKMAENPRPRLTEIGVADKLEEFRREDPDLVSLSFATISAVGGHASKPHYETTNETSVPLDYDQCYLVDSGGQYILGGTTDVTRTVFFSANASAYYRECYTRVVMSHVDLARQSFPATDMTGVRLDTLAKMNLWQVGLDFGHGTGHGVGSYLGVHEGPISIASKGDRAWKEKIDTNMTVTIEPGYYEDNVFGIRIENAYAVADNDNTKYKMPNSRFLCFEPLTLAPIETKHIVKQMLRPEQISWLNWYHSEVLRQIGNELEKKEKWEALEWLKEQCKAI